MYLHPWAFCDFEGRLAENIDIVQDGVVLNIEKGQWHGLKCLEGGTVLLEAKDGGYRPFGLRSRCMCLM